jgi:tRNA/tmRNA/rRNA uracil-C5-methylase (TrmA/RlmC/RlmD family)
VAFIQGDAARLVKFQSDLVSLDPPRAGLSDLALEGLLKLRPPRILYVSCDPATWARDVGKLVRDGGYRLEVIQPWDFYPQTHHVEVLSLLTLG